MLEEEQPPDRVYFEPTQEFMGSLISVTLKKPENFLFVKETLTRVGIAAKTERRLCQSCHILNKKGKHYIMHFKELFLLDGKTANFSDDDKARRNTIANLLAEWDLITVVNPDVMQEPRIGLNQIKIIPFADKGNWVLESKYQIGNKKRVY